MWRRMLESAPSLFPLPWSTGLRSVSGAITLTTPTPALPMVITGQAGSAAVFSSAWGRGTVVAGAAAAMAIAADTAIAAATAIAAPTPIAAATGLVASIQGAELMAAAIEAA